MKQVIFNGSTLGHENVYGVQRYTTEILREIDKIALKEEIHVVVSEKAQHLPKFKSINVHHEKVIGESKISTRLWDYFRFTLFARRKKFITVDLIGGFSFFGSDIVCIYDCIPELFPNNADTFMAKVALYFYKIRVKANIRKSKIIITDSENTKGDIIRLYKADPDKIRIIPCGWQHFLSFKSDDTILESLGLEDNKYFFALGSRYYHKNSKWIINAAVQNSDEIFVISGSNSLSSSDRELDKTKLPNLIYTGYLSDQQIKALMIHCKAFIQPSLYEGFGLPPLEAMSVGAKCIVSNSSSMPEIYEKSVWYIDPTNYSSINMEKIMRGKIEENIIILQKYSWERSARELLSIIRELEK